MLGNFLRTLSKYYCIAQNVVVARAVRNKEIHDQLNSTRYFRFISVTLTSQACRNDLLSSITHLHSELLELDSTFIESSGALYYRPYGVMG